MAGSTSSQGVKNDTLQNTSSGSQDTNKSANCGRRAQNEPLNFDLNNNLNVLKEIFCYPVNQDFIIREVYIKSINRKGVLLFLQGMTDVETVERHIITPLLNHEIENQTSEDIISILMTRVLTGKGVHRVDNFKRIATDIVNGNTILLVQASSLALSLSTVGYEHRAVEKPTNENTLKGPKEAFVESEQTNRSLIRKYSRDEKLVSETINVGEKTETPVIIMYIADIANTNIVRDVKKRISNIKASKVGTAAVLEQYIEDRPYSLVPTVLSTERPDRVAAFLQEGHVAVLMDGSPSALVVPITFWSVFHNPEDQYQRLIYGNFIRIIRIMCVFIALLTPGLFIAVTTYHVDMIPTDLVLAIASSREKLPFPAIMEVIIMEFAFEILREAGVRIPTPIGPTIGIVGALILGQAAVEANIVSPILVIIVAITGLSSFAIPEMSLSFMIRIARFLFLLSGALMGFYGLATLFVISLAYVSSIKSFGVYFMSPFAPIYRSSKDLVARPPVWRQWIRPMNIQPKEAVRGKKPQGS